MKKISLTFLALCMSLLTLAQSSGDLENQFYFRFGYSLPSTSFLGNDEAEFWDYFTRNGATFELGSIFMLNKAALSDGLRLGINVDYAEFSYHQLSEIDAADEFAVYILKVASKIGPTLSFSPAPRLVFDVFVKARIPWVGGIGLATIDELEEVFLAPPGIGVATGINIRYSILMLGFEFNTDNMKYESRDYPGEYFGNISDGSDKTPMPSFSFTLGLSF